MKSHRFNADFTISDQSYEIEQQSESDSRRIQFDNSTVANISMPAPGILEIESRSGTNDSLIISGGIHGNEKSGIVILDSLITDILSGKTEVHQNLLLILGNLPSMQINNGLGDRYIEPQFEVESNLNRCFNQGIFPLPKNYAQRRANKISQAVERALTETSEGLDIHQSFQIPTTGEVRKNENKSDYVYAIIYPQGIKAAQDWVRTRYSDILAGIVINKPEQSPVTFAGYLQAQGLHGATFEMGEIGNIGTATYTPQLLKNLRKKIGGVSAIETPLDFDIWNQVLELTKTSSDFALLGPDGAPLNNAPIDFIPLGYSPIARDSTHYYENNPNQSLLFADTNPLIGDRGGVVIEKK